MQLKKHFIILIIITLPFISLAQSDIGLTTIVLVRHAEKVKNDSPDPELSSAGIERALRLKQLFINADISAIYSTNYKRTKNTVLLLAEALDLKVEMYDPRDNKITKQLLNNHEGETILVSGHSNTTPQLVNTLINQEKYKSLDENEYGKIFIVTISNQEETKVVELSY
ncbi:MAG: histidine phosphatase family protein [Cyclobacteriaceae bacterium]|nr:histidine phosphatase family protein [Cyclobacteriaceae bacterium]